MLLVFYKVDSKFERHSFDGFDTTNKDEAMQILQQVLQTKNYHIYDLNGNGKYCNDAYDFEVDYNDTLLDGGYWSIVLKSLDENDLLDITKEEFNL